MQTIISIAGIAVVVIVLVAIAVSRYKVAGPAEAFVITGSKGKGDGDLSGQKVVVGAGTLVLPFVQSLERVPLAATQIGLQVAKAPSQQGISLNLIAVAQVKVAGDEASIRAAAQRFPGNTMEQIHAFTTETLEGELRAIAGTLTVEQIIQDRSAFATKVSDAAEASLAGQGLILDNFTIKDVSDADGTYLRDLGRAQAAIMKRDADIAEATARQQSEAKRLESEEQIAISERTLALKQAEIKAETDAAQAEAAAAGPLAKAARDQEILNEQAKVAESQAALTEKQLEIDVRKPADAERYRIEQAAEAARNATVSQAEGARTAKVAQAEADRTARELAAQAHAVEGAKQGEAEKARRAAIADAVRLEGEAQAASERAVGTAKAEAMSAQADAYEKYGEAAILEMLVNVLPQVAKELAAPMSAIDKLTVVSTDGAGALPKAVVSNMAQLTDLLKGTTGMDLNELIATKLAGSTTAGAPKELNGTAV